MATHRRRKRRRPNRVRARRNKERTKLLNGMKIPHGSNLTPNEVIAFIRACPDRVTAWDVVGRKWGRNPPKVVKDFLLEMFPLVEIRVKAKRLAHSMEKNWPFEIIAKDDEGFLLRAKSPRITMRRAKALLGMHVKKSGDLRTKRSTKKILNRLLEKVETLPPMRRDPALFTLNIPLPEPNTEPQPEPNFFKCLKVRDETPELETVQMTVLPFRNIRFDVDEDSG